MEERRVKDLITVDRARAILDSVPVEPRLEVVALGSAVGRRLAEDVTADRDYPPFDKAMMDGFAACAGETAGEFELLGEVTAGSSWTGPPLRGRQAVAIMTGAPLPPGDGPMGLVPVEASRSAGENRIHLETAVAPDRYISRRGSDRPAGSVLLRAGTLLGPRHVGALASVGEAEVRTLAPPRCVVLTTGDEVVPINAAPAVHQIRNSNNPMLMALLARLGCEVVDGGHVPDDLDATRRELAQWLDSSCDCLFITGGMSMGERDYVPRVLSELGVAAHISKLKIKPGKPFVFGTRACERGFVAGADGARRGRHTTCVFGLPGNPVSAYVCTLVLAARLLLRLAGASPADVEAGYQELPLAEELGANGPRQFYQPARLGAGRVRPLAWKGSADVFTLAEADALIERPAEDPSRAVGSVVRILPLP